jgi:hypothetical protein
MSYNACDGMGPPQMKTTKKIGGNNAYFSDGKDYNVDDNCVRMARHGQ